MTKQQIFNKVARHLLRQRKKAEAGSICRYRTDDGLKCAVGVLIPNAKYKPEFEGSMIGISDETESDEIRKAAGISERQIDLARALQNVHDDYEPEHWRQELADVAHNFGLNWPRGLAK